MRSIVLRLTRVPLEPHIPAGSADSAMVFHPGRKYYYLRVLLWIAAHALTLALVLVFWAAAWLTKLPPVVHTVWLVVSSSVVVVFLISLPLTFFMQRLNYELRWYIVTDQSLRIRRGILSVQEFTMTFANIQEIRVSVNPLQKLLGLANVEVHSAGGGGERGDSANHVARFESVDNANAIRDLMVERLRIYRDSGLGDHPDKAEAPSVTTTASDTINEARNVLREVSALRTSLAAIRL